MPGENLAEQLLQPPQPLGHAASGCRCQHLPGFGVAHGHSVGTPGTAGSGSGDPAVAAVEELVFSCKTPPQAKAAGFGGSAGVWVVGRTPFRARWISCGLGVAGNVPERARDEDSGTRCTAVLVGQCLSFPTWPQGPQDGAGGFQPREHSIGGLEPNHGHPPGHRVRPTCPCCHLCPQQEGQEPGCDPSLSPLPSAALSTDLMVPPSIPSPRPPESTSLGAPTPANPVTQKHS